MIPLRKAYRMSLISAGSISLDSTFKHVLVSDVMKNYPTISLSAHSKWLWCNPFNGKGQGHKDEKWSRIHEHTISLRFVGIILRILRLEVSVYNVYITNQFQTTFAGAMCNVHSKEGKTFAQIASKNSASGVALPCNCTSVHIYYR